MKNKPFEVLRGTRLLLNIPELKEPSFELNEKDKEELMKEQMKQWSALEVYATGDKVEDVTEGDHVYIRVDVLAHAEKIKVGEEVKMLVNEHDVIIIW
jgi:hypothetical protein